MENLSLEQKQQQFNEFFSIQHGISANFTLWPADRPLPDYQSFVANMPYAFKVATEVASLELNALRPLRALGEHAQQLMDFLNHQSRKIDLIMSFVLHQQDDDSARFTTESFGGGGVVLKSDRAMEIGRTGELKLFLTDEAAAVYCLAEVIGCEAKDDIHHITLIYRHIREEDQDLLVKASLHLQSKQLKARAAERRQNGENA
ncbi:PilZ domain-containing protein [Bowmanella sp. JS7-9]|uniref:PilZ domain-containing protein n=1 Tax=Alteromonadaceae TaxID=72275 RepID=UPI00103ADDBA|nr:PilZ domain-containing protein [Bowmanella sp. JS7-9]TBX26085.1 hypothetical protein TK45_02500 [Bowmanella sp. JS7-9]